MQDGLLYYQLADGDEPRVVVPADADIRYSIAYEVHDVPCAGHLGREKTYALLSDTFWWARMYKWVSQYVRTCDTCQRVKPTPAIRAPLVSLPVPGDCWQSVSMDFFFGLPRSAEGHNGVLVFVDRLSKMVHLAPVSDTIDAEGSARVFLDVVFRLHGLPKSIVSDRDPRFTSDFWSALFRLLGTQLDMSTTDHPESDGQTERANRVVEDILRSFCAANPASWTTQLPMAEFAINNAVHASTGLTPFYVNGLRHPALPLCLMGASESEGGEARLLASQINADPKRAVRESVSQFMSTRQATITRIRDEMAHAQNLQKENADRHGRRNEHIFAEGDYVLVSTKNLSEDAVSSLGSSKLLPRYLGPFKVLKRVGNAYKLDLPAWFRAHPTFYVGMLKAYLRPDSDEPGEADASASPPLEPEESSEAGSTAAHSPRTRSVT